MKTLARKGDHNVPFLIELAAILRTTGEEKAAGTVEKKINVLMSE